MDKIEMSLDDIIESHKPQRGGGHRGGLNRPGGSGRRGNSNRSQNGYRGQHRNNRGGSMRGGILKGRVHGGIQRSTHSSRGNMGSSWKLNMYEGVRENRPSVAGRLGGGSDDGGKLMVSNLDSGVSESDITALFEDVGPLKSVTLHYDRSARSLGSADVVFERRSDAIKAMKQYNGVPLDGRRMSIQLATAEVPVPTQSLRRQGGGPRGGRGANRGGRGGSGPRRQQREAKTAEELDAELDAYIGVMKQT